MRAVSPPLPSADDTMSRAVLRDGTVVRMRLAEPADHQAVARFFHDLSSESRRLRFFSLAEPSDALVDRFCKSSDLSETATLLALRLVDGELRPIAVGSYFKTGNACAEVAFAVDDHFQGKGIGTILLERLATIAASHGFDRFEAMTASENSAMLDVFRESGFEIRSKSDRGCVNVKLSLDPATRSVAGAERRESQAAAASLRPLFEPASLAIVGVSRKPGSIGRRVLKAVAACGFTGPVYPINPNAQEIDGRRCYPSLSAIPRGVDLAVIAVPKTLVLGAVDDCAAAGVKTVVVITAGFAETGADGRALQQALLDKVRGYGMRMVGPNCMGLLNTNARIRLNASFSPVVPPAGRVAFSSQSGALGMAILELANERGVGLSTFVSVGNKADVSGNDLLQYWEADPNTSVILLYLESFGNTRRFGRLARRISRVKPIVAVKAGRTGAGSRAAGSHTAALAASDTAVDALFRQSGVIRAGTIDEMFDITACLDAQPLPRGRRVSIVTNAGGPGILAVDACEAAGLRVGPFTDATRAKLAAFLPSEASVANPVDMVASAGPEEYRRAVEVALTAEDTDALIVIYTPVDPQTSDETLGAIRQGIESGRAAGAAEKPILACLMAGGGTPRPLVVGGERIPAYAFPENAARALAKIASYAEWRKETPGLFWDFEDIRADDARSVCRAATANGDERWLNGDETHAVLGAFGLPMAAGTLARSADDAVALGHVLGFPVVAKLSAQGLTHKSDVGGVRLNLENDVAVRRAFVDIMARAKKIAPQGQIDGVLIQTMITDGVETMIGVADDPLFGPLVAFGLGGIHVEILGDVQFRVAPLTDRDVDELLHGIRGLPLLNGYRGHPAADLEALRDLLLRVSRLAIEVPEIVELDLNPVMALSPGKGCRIVDARVKVRATTAKAPQANV